MIAIDPDHVYQINYRCELQDASEVWSIQFAVITGLEQLRCERLFFECAIPREAVEHWRPGVSSTFTSIPSRLRATTRIRETEVLERNVGDLITMYVTNAARAERAIILVAGPPLPGLVGRLAYRCLNRNAIVAFVTWESSICQGPQFKSEGSVNSLFAKWCGPFPAFHEDSLTRAFYSYGQEGPATNSVRLDLLSQPLGADNLSEDVFVGIREKLELVDRIVCSKGAFKFPSGQMAYIPHEMGTLSLSLRWTDRRVKMFMEQHRPQLTAATGPEKFAAVMERGITAIEPMDVLAARFGSGDQNYIRERLFESLERRTIASGPLQGITDFLGQEGALS
jgi:hypothetical protein